jgi:multidrug efflux pump subunit AcrA (membrane-fusion protein)
MKRFQKSFSALARTPLIIAALLPVLAVAQVAPVVLAVVERRDIVETLSLTGSLSSPNSARLSPDVEGRLVSLEVDAGQRVNIGDILFKLDDELARLELAQAIAAEHEAEANLADVALPK